ncbi:MAG: hypothetical protein FWD38_07445 [Oscillospiraceae bacterium]|nr:hypothetical protein [Oscillospiraceae bacterium]
MKNGKMNNSKWIEKFDKNNRPHNSNNGMLGFWEDFWTDETLKMFGDFSNELNKKYGLDLTHINYSVAYGWKFKYSKSGVILVKNVYIFDDCFGIDEIVVKSREDYIKAIAHVNSLYTDDFLKEYEEKRLKRNAKQAERGKRLMARRKEELNKVLESIEPEKLNKFKWSPCVSRHSIKRLYNLNAKLIYDEELADEVGYTMYARCLQGRDETTLNYSGKLLCHNCKKVHISPSNGVILCSCGYTYIFHEYRKSFQKARMPSGAATPFFNEFISKWEKAKTYHDKMLAIDYVIHECHLNMISNVKRSFAGCNLIQGTKKQVSELILDLAYN